MNRYVTYLLLVLILVSCKDRLVAVDPQTGDAVELKGVEAYMDGNIPAKAPALDAYNYVGRSNFVNNDQMVLTTIKRTESTIPGFHYSGIVYDHVIEDGQTSGGWNRDNTQGRTAASEQVPERIYWSDSKNGHTYIGYSVPQQPVGGTTFDWNVRDVYEGSSSDGIPVYYGSLGDPTQLQSIVGEVVTNYIDYTNNLGETPVRDNLDDPNSALSYKTGNDKIKCDDILLTYDDAKVAETGGSVAKLYFHHGLAQVRVIVNIQGFSASTTAEDSKSVVSDMVLKNMLTLYKWRQESYAAEKLDATYDASNITEIYGSDVSCDQKKDVHLWIPRPAGTGSGTGKQFTFYALAVPQVMGVDNATTSEQIAGNLNFEFKVKYPNPMNPDVDVTKTYRAHLPNSVEFRAGHCTTINITLNHNNEQMTVGAEYMDWQLVETPDQGELKKHDTFLTSTARKTGPDAKAPGATIVGDQLATEDDATWLYNAGTAESPVIKDIYGNNGTSEHPYTISTADQLLSFAYEVSNGRTFEEKYVKLDADLVLQPNIELMRDDTGFYTLDSEGKRVAATGGITWLGIGDAGHAFNGIFLGGNRTVKRLYGSPFFVNIGPKGRIDALLLEEVLGVTSGGGALASLNKGVICASSVTSVAFGKFNVVKKDENIMVPNSGEGYTSTSSSVAGPLVGRNEGVVFSCHSQGEFTTDAARVGGLVGYNTGALVVSYAATKATTSAASPVYRGIVGYNDYKEYYSSTDKQDNEFGSITYCFFDKTIANNVDEGQSLNQVYPKTTFEMKRSDFIGENDRYSKLTAEEKTILATLEEHERSGQSLSTEEQTLKDRLLLTLNGNIAYFAYHSTLCPKVIRDAYPADEVEAHMLVLVNHFLNHYYAFRVGGYPQVY